MNEVNILCSMYANRGGDPVPTPCWQFVPMCCGSESPNQRLEKASMREELTGE